MLGNLAAHQGQAQQQGHSAQQNQQQQQGQNQIQQPGQAPPPPPLNGQDLNLSNILHYLQLEWRRYERERNEWEIERAEMRARIALLEGERRSFENTRMDLLRRIKMLEFALRMERSKQLNQSVGQMPIPSKANLVQGQVKDDNKEGSSSSSPRSEDVHLPSENRLSIASISALPNGAAVHGQKDRPHTWAGANWPASSSTTAATLGKPALGRDPKSRARSKDYLKQCLQEISYLTSPQAMNPLPNRPLLSTNPALPLTLPNVPSFDQMAYNGRPRKIVPEVGKDFPPLNGMPLMAGPQTAPPSSSQVPLLERDSRPNPSQGISLLPTPGQQSQPNPAIATLQAQQQQQSQSQSASSAQQQPPLSIQTIQQQFQSESPSDLKEGSGESSEPQLQTAIFRPGREWKEELERVRLEKASQQGGVLSGALAWDSVPKEEEDEAKEEEQEIEEEETASAISEEDNNLWRPRRTLRNHLDAVRAIAFHPKDLCLASGGDDFSVKIWRMDVAGLAASSSKATTDIEPQLTLRGHTAPITALAHSPSKRLIYSASLDASIRVWVLPPASHTTYAPFDNSRSHGELIGHSAAVWGLALFGDEKLLVSCGAEGLVYVWDVSAQSGLGPVMLRWGYYGLDSEEEHQDGPNPGATVLEAIKPDIKKVAVGYQNGVVKIFVVDTGKEVVSLGSEEGPDMSNSQVNAITSHPTMPMLVTGHEDKHIRVWDIATGQCTHSMLAHLDAVTSLSIDAAGFSMVSGGHDCSLRFWDLLGSRACIQETTNHREKGREGVLAVEFHSHLPFMASAGADGVLKLYASS
ncbi:WD40 repeat-like protein [Schizopora paradoxa]|uniref:WD40 repeat-like protein n=1 Tax=Schizopora paradoxa TaxID=27342 RepID=A0A0H2RJI6_9AGAM|nr:WD40 repeat-like protein [Schizopora paradoxa]